MMVRINLACEGGGESFLVDTDKIQDKDLKDAILFTAEAPGKLEHHKTFGSYDVIHGEILQDGYAMNQELNKIAVKEEGVIEITASTNY